jgi:hypothetical protein
MSGVEWRGVPSRLADGLKLLRSQSSWRFEYFECCDYFDTVLEFFCSIRDGEMFNGRPGSR